MNRAFLKAAATGAVVALVGLIIFFIVRGANRDDRIPDYNPANFTAADERPRPQLDAPYVSTEYDIVRAMLQIANVGAEDYVIDLGSGDGRIPIIAARERGARGLGVDIDPARVRESEQNARQAGVTDKVTFRQEDLFETPINDATVLTLYLLPELNLRLRPRILSQMRAGTRVVSNMYDMGDWRPDRREMVQNSPLYIWTVPARVGGRWLVAAEDGGAGALTLTQRYQDISGTLTLAGRTVPITEARLQGDRISFTVNLGQGQRRFDAQIADNRMEGPGWRAERTAG